MDIFGLEGLSQVGGKEEGGGEFLERPSELGGEGEVLDSSDGFYGSVLIILLFLILLALFLKWIGRKFSVGSGGGDEVVKVLWKGLIGSNQWIQIIDIGSKVYILGVSGNHISMIDMIDDPEGMHEIRGYCDQKKRSDRPIFLDFLNYYWKNMGKNMGKK